MRPHDELACGLPEWYVQAEEAVVRALKLDPTNAEAWVTRGRILWSPVELFNDRTVRGPNGEKGGIRCRESRGGKAESRRKPAEPEEDDDLDDLDDDD